MLIRALVFIVGGGHLKGEEKKEKGVQVVREEGHGKRRRGVGWVYQHGFIRLKRLYDKMMLLIISWSAI